MLANGKFDAFVTVDQNLVAEQPTTAPAISIVLLKARTNRLQDLEPLIPDLLGELDRIRPGQLVTVG